MITIPIYLFISVRTHVFGIANSYTSLMWRYLHTKLITKWLVAPSGDRVNFTTKTKSMNITLSSFLAVQLYVTIYQKE